MHFPVCVAETLAWRRAADLHVMISSAAIAMLGWTLNKEQVAQIFHQEEGRYIQFTAELFTVHSAAMYCSSAIVAALW